jgi:hypothetical protein
MKLFQSCGLLFHLKSSSICLALGLVLPAFGADFTVETPGSQFAFQINGVNSPTLTLVRGRTYTFDVNTTPGFHPFRINSPGVVNNNISTGTITYTVPTAATNYFYDCGFHGVSMRGEIVTVPPADFTVRTPDGQFAFQINSTNSPTLTLVRGRTYTFDVQTTPGFHPFHIESPGVINNDIDTGTMTYTVPMAVANYTYDCVIHFGGMTGDIITVAPPSVQILGLSVTTNIVLTSTGSNTWTLNPEFSTNLSTTNWFALTVQTNRFFNGTNEIICGKPPGDAVFFRIRAQTN